MERLPALGSSRRVVALRLALAAACLWPSAATRGDEPQDVTLPPSVRGLAFSPDGRRLAAAAADGLERGVLVVWDAETLEVRWERREPVGFPSVAFAPDGQVIALARFAPEALLLDAETGAVRREFIGHGDHARCVAFTPDGRRLITGSYDRTVKLWDPATGEAEATLEGHQEAVYSVAVSPDGSQLATTDARAYAARLWDLNTLQQRHAFQDLGSLVPQATFSPDGRLLAVASWAGHLSLFDTETFEPWLRIHEIGGAHWSDFSPDGTKLAVALTGPQLYVFNVGRSADEQTKERVAALLAAFRDDAYERRESAHEELAALGMAAEPLLREAMRSDSAEVRWRARRLLRRLARPESAVALDGPGGEFQCVAFSPDGRLLAAGDDSGRVTLWRVGDWQREATLSVAEADGSRD